MDFFDLVKNALPADVEPKELLELVPAALWKKSPRAASAYALRKTPRINWQAYRERNPEVKASEIDPCLHFLRSGIYEGKKLISWHPLKTANNPNAPLFSIIIANCNNELHIGKCLRSAVSQTLENIEIIVVDDASTDNSPRIIQEYASRDRRIKAILKDKNGGLFMTRKIGIMAASGQYLTFLDGDDFLDISACQTLYNAIVLGYDIVENCMNVVNAGNAEEKEITWWLNYANNGVNQEYWHDEIANQMFIERKLRWNVCGRAILREICVYAYNDLPDGYIMRMEDFHSMTAITRIARNLYKIEDKLYFYRFGSGISTLQDLRRKYRPWFNLGDTTNAIKNYIDRYSLEVGFENIHYLNCSYSVRTWLEAVPPDEAGAYFDLIKRQYGLKTLLKVLVEKFSDQIGAVAEKFRICMDSQSGSTTPVKTVGIYYHRLTGGGVQTIIASMARMLQEQGYQVIIFVEEKSAKSVNLPASIKIYQLPPGYGGAANVVNHLLEFRQVLAECQIDLMFHAGAFAPYLLWDIILLNNFHIPVIINCHGSECMQFLKIWAKYMPQDQMEVFKCADAVTCLSRTSELYLRINGINALYIPNPVKRPLPNQSTQALQNIAIMARFDDPLKQLNQSLLVFREIHRVKPWIKFYLIGDFKTDAQREEFFQKIRTYGLSDNIILTGWVEEPEVFLRKCAIFLSTSYIEAFPLGIAEAQSLGLACVIYDIPIEATSHNESIIVVAQKDYQGAAKAIIDLLDDPHRLKFLSEVARQQMSQYSFERFFENIISLVQNFPSHSPLKYYSDDIYRSIISYTAYYAERPLPGKWD